MKRLGSALVALCALIPSVGCDQVGVTSPSIVITHVTVIDIIAGRPLRDITVVITRNRIMGVGTTSATKVPKGARVVDAGASALCCGGKGLRRPAGPADLRHISETLPAIPST